MSGTGIRAGEFGAAALDYEKLRRLNPATPVGVPAGVLVAVLEAAGADQKLEPFGCFGAWVCGCILTGVRPDDVPDRCPDHNAEPLLAAVEGEPQPARVIELPRKRT